MPAKVSHIEILDSKKILIRRSEVVHWSLKQILNIMRSEIMKGFVRDKEDIGFNVQMCRKLVKISKYGCNMLTSL